MTIYCNAFLTNFSPIDGTGNHSSEINEKDTIPFNYHYSQIQILVEDQG